MKDFLKQLSLYAFMGVLFYVGITYINDPKYRYTVVAGAAFVGLATLNFTFNSEEERLVEAEHNQTAYLAAIRGGIYGLSAILIIVAALIGAVVVRIAAPN